MAYGDSGTAGGVAWEATTIPANRLFVWSSSRLPALPAAGADVDGVTLRSGDSDPGPGTSLAALFAFATPRAPFQVQSGGVFASGVSLSTDANGRVVLAGAGKVVARALDASAGAGAFPWVCFSSGR